jgi:hypothetical protein
MATYGHYKTGVPQPRAQYIGDDMVQAEAYVRIYSNNKLVVAINLEPGHHVADVTAMVPTSKF